MVVKIGASTTFSLTYLLKGYPELHRRGQRSQRCGGGALETSKSFERISTQKLRMHGELRCSPVFSFVS